jgi:hypothetical protein
VPAPKNKPSEKSKPVSKSESFFFFSRDNLCLHNFSLPNVNKKNQKAISSKLRIPSISSIKEKHGKSIKVPMTRLFSSTTV